MTCSVFTQTLLLTQMLTTIWALDKESRFLLLLLLVHFDSYYYYIQTDRFFL